jgi:D-psicose/D-tagatose/L-ribulose 3-epimerase
VNPMGINLWNWTGNFDESKVKYIDRAAKFGYTAIEIGLENTDLNLVPIREAIDKYKLQVTLCAALSKGRDISSFDETTRQNTKDYMKRCFEIGEKLGATIFAGPIYAGGGKAHYLNPTDKVKEWNLAVEGLREMADIAAKHGISLAIEPLNRYRTSVVNTLDQALHMVLDINKDNVGILFDTYQANIEEVDIYASLNKILKSGKLLHVQLSDSNRYAPGMGHIDFIQVFTLLKNYKYEGHITIETFASGVFDCGWIELDKPDNVARIGIQTMKELLQSENEVANV